MDQEARWKVAHTLIQSAEAMDIALPKIPGIEKLLRLVRPAKKDFIGFAGRQIRVLPWVDLAREGAWDDTTKTVVVNSQDFSWYGPYTSPASATRSAWHISTKGDTQRRRVPLSRLKMVRWNDWPPARATHDSSNTLHRSAAKYENNVDANTKRRIVKTLLQAAAVLNGATISVDESDPRFIAVSGPYDLMKNVYPLLKKRGWKYRSYDRSWIFPKEKMTPRKRSGVDKILAPYMGEGGKTKQEREEDDEISRRRDLGLEVSVPLDIRKIPKQAGGIYNSTTKTWLLPDLAAVEKVNRAVKEYKEQEQQQQAAKEAQRQAEIEEYKKRKEAEVEEEYRRREEKRRENAERLAKKYPKVLRTDGSSKTDHAPIGHVFRDKKGDVWVIDKIDSQFIPEDGLSFGLSRDRGWAFTVYCRNPTDEEVAGLVEREAAHKQKADAKKRRVEIKDLIMKKGKMPKGSNRLRGDRVLMSNKRMTLYGGGSWFVIEEPRWIWYVQNNGADGDNWSHNNVETGGAGAMGWRIRYDALLAGEIKGLDEVIGE
jgi:hypothetical protein